MKIMLIGGAGFIGSYITKQLLEQGDKVVIFDAFISFFPPFKSNYENMLKKRFEGIQDRVEFIRGDIRHKGELLNALKETKPDKVVLLAALPIATLSNKHSEDAMSINLVGTVNVLEALRFVPVKQFIYSSSSMVYGDFEYQPADEDHPRNPIDVYGGTKKSGELMTKVFSRQYNIPYTIIRPSAVYGPTDVNRRVTQIFVENALKGKPLILHNDGSSKLDFTYIVDTAQGFIRALKSEKAIGQTFNITRGEGRSLMELAKIIKKHIPEAVIDVQPVPAGEKRPERGALSIEKARKLLGYEPKYSLEEGMGRYIEFMKDVHKDAVHKR